MKHIQLFVPKYNVEACLAEIRECLEVGWTGLGFKTVKFEEAWKEYTGLPHAHFLNTATAGLELAVRILKEEHGWKEGDEVISTALTFVSTNHAIMEAGLKPVFADVDDTLCLDPKSIEERITPKTKAVMYVGMGGNAGKWSEVVALCKKHHLALILDAAHMSGTRYKGAHVGHDADCTVFSFQAVKNLPTADSGMICFRDAHLDERARKLAWVGINKDTFVRHGSSTLGGYKWMYDVVAVSSNTHGNSITAAIGLVQLKELDGGNERRRELASRYRKNLSGNQYLRFIEYDADTLSSQHLFQIRVPEHKREELLTYLNSESIFPGVHYRINTEYPMYRYGLGTCPRAELASREIVTLPLHLHLTDEDVDFVCEKIRTFFGEEKAPYKRMKVLMIAPTPFFADRGCHTQIYEEIKALQKLGHEIVLCTYGLGRDMPGITIVRTINFPWYRKLSAGPSFTKMLLLPFLTLTVLKTIVTFKPDIIHAHLHEGALIARVCRVFFPKKKYLFDMQGSLTGETLQHGFVKKGSLGYRLLALLERRIAHWSFVITQSDTMIRELDAFGVPPERRRNVMDGVDTDLFHPLPFDADLAREHDIDEKRPRVLYMGLLERYQGSDYMFEAFAKVAEEIPNVQCIVIGYPNEETYAARCKELGIERNVVFLGRVAYTDVPRYLSLSPIGIAPKIAVTEGDGKIYNYMASGLATVAFDRSVAHEILGDTGLFAQMESADDLAQKIIWALEHPAEAKALGAKARERAIETLSWDAVGRRINEVYQKL